MLAKVPVVPSPDLTPAPPSFQAALNTAPNPPATNQFSFTDGNGNPVANLVWVDDDTTILITLAEGLSFHSPNPIVWALPPVGGEPITTLAGNTLSFGVKPPIHVLSPWVFRIVVDTPDVIGIRSQNIYLAKQVSGDPETFTLKYEAANGNFSLLDSSDFQNGVILGTELVMVNVFLPRTFSVSLQPEGLPPLSSAVFAENPLSWSFGIQPDWITVSPGMRSDEVQISIHESAIGRSVGLQFAVEITVNGETIGVLSPDPILINATIGDG